VEEYVPLLAVRREHLWRGKGRDGSGGREGEAGMAQG